MPRSIKPVLIVLVSALAVVLSGSSRSKPQAAKEFDKVFPLTKGTFWVYHGPVESGGSDGAIRKTITWKMEVTNVIKRQDITAAVVKGFPDDLWWYTEDTKPRDSLIVQLYPARFYLLGPNEIQKALEALRDEKNILQGLMREPELFLDLPLTRGKRFGETELITRTDEFYSWVVSDGRQTKLEGIKGVSSTRSWTVDTISEFTLGSHEEFDFVSGVGIVRYMGHHNGTISDFNMKLVEFHPGNE